VACGLDAALQNLSVAHDGFLGLANIYQLISENKATPEPASSDDRQTHQTHIYK